MNEIIQELEEQNANDRPAKSRSSSKSQSFVRRLVANLERNNSENSVCSADEEFLTKYYKKTKSPREYLQEITGENLRESVDGGLQQNRPDNVRRNLQEDLRRKSRRSSHGNFLPKKIDIQYKYSKAETNDASPCKDDPRKVHGHEELRSGDGSNFSINNPPSMSSFGKRQSCTRTCQHFESSNFPSSTIINDGTLANNVEGAFASTKKEKERERERENSSRKPVCLEAEGGKKSGRKKSFKDVMSSMMKWRKTGNSECHRVPTDDSKKPRFNSRNRDAPTRIPSIGDVIFRGNEEEYLAQKFERNATIHPVYGGRKSQEVPRVIAGKLIHKSSFAKDIVDYDFDPYASVDDAESLVKPSAIKHMAKRFSRLSEGSQL